MQGEVITVEDDVQPGEPLLEPVMRAGERIGSREPLAESRRRAGEQLKLLPQALRQLNTDPPYAVEISRPLRELADLEGPQR